MAPLGETLRKCFSLMARGSQDDAGVVRAVCDRLVPALHLYMDSEALEQRAAVQPYLRELLQAAGWLYPCFMPSSRLGAPQQRVVQEAWTWCMYLAGDALRHNPVADMAAFLLLAQERTAPKVPGTLVWMGDMAAQLVPGLIQGVLDLDRIPNLLRLCCVWDTLADHWPNRDYSLQSALMHLQPYMLRLVAHVAMQPIPPPAADTEQGRKLRQTVIACLQSTTHVSGAAMDWSWYAEELRGAGSTSTRSSGASSAARTGWLPSSHARPTLEQTAAVLEHEAFWWGGVAALAGLHRQLAVQEQSNMAGLPPIGLGSAGNNGSSSSSSSGNRAAALCPWYHREAAWPVLVVPEARYLGERPFAHCLELLLVREALGYLPGALQQLQPFRAAQQTTSSSSTTSRSSGSKVGQGAAEFTRLVLQWPMNMHVLNSSGSGSLTCQCCMPTCHLCTPPPPVTLQQLRLLLEVVCLLCQDCSTPATSPQALQALQAPLLLALLLQRASPGVRAAFLNSEDGTRLLVALQLAAPPTEVVPGAPTGFSFYNRAGALSLVDVLDPMSATPWQFPAACRAAFTLAWCWLEVDTDAAGAAAAGQAAGTPSSSSSPSPSSLSSSSSSSSSSAAAAAAAAAGLVPACILTPAAVSYGSVLCVSGWSWSACLHMLELPPASLRLAAGVQPSLALFATLEGMLRPATMDYLPLLLATLLAAVKALLESEAPGGCGCSQQPPPAGGGELHGHSSSSSSSSGAACSSSSSTEGPAPGVVEAVASVAVSVSKVLLSVGIYQRCPERAHGELQVQREVVLLSVRLGNAVLQLALQQLQRHQQQQQQQQAASTHAVLQLVQASQRLMRHAADAAAGDIIELRAYLLAEMAKSFTGDNAAQRTVNGQCVAAINATADSWIMQLVTAQVSSTRSVLAYLHTGRLRLSALSSSAAHGRQGAELSPAAAAAAAAAAGGSSHRAGARSTQSRSAAQSRSGQQGEACGVAGWCPVHSSSPAPESLRVGEETPLHELDDCIIDTRDSMVGAVTVPLLGCGYAGCGQLDGPSEATLVENHKRVVCAGCGVVRYCSRICARKAWPTHRKVCGRLGAALGWERPATTATAGSSSRGGGSRRAAAKPAAAAAAAAKGGGRGQAAAAGTVQRPAPGASNDCYPVTDQLLGPPAGGRVCSWCGAASQELLRCGRCKQVWYCGVEHQRAAWKAGHKQECAAAGSTG